MYIHKDKDFFVLYISTANIVSYIEPLSDNKPATVDNNVRSFRVFNQFILCAE